MGKLDKELKYFMEKLNSYIRMTEDLFAKQQEADSHVDSLKSQLSSTLADLETRKKQYDTLQSAYDQLKYLEATLAESKSTIVQVQQESKTKKTIIDELSESLKQREITIQLMTERLSEKDSGIEKLQGSLDGHIKNAEHLALQLETEKTITRELSTQMETLKSEHTKHIENLKLEMGEKVLKAQARIARQANTSTAGSGLTSSELKEIFKKKLANIDAIHAKEVAELRKTIARQQQQLRNK
ncbi:hyaluronan-mediated motility receptor-like isoform X2 [Watersipora subatra]